MTNPTNTNTTATTKRKSKAEMAAMEQQAGAQAAHDLFNVLGSSTLPDDAPLAAAEGAALAALNAGTGRSAAPEAGKVFIHFAQIGKAIFVFTPAFFYIGRVVAVDSQGMLLSEACWVGHTGSLEQMISSGKMSTCIPLNSQLYIPHSSISTALPWNHAIPTQAMDR